MKKFSIVIPVYNGSGTISELVSRICSVFKKKKFNDFEIVIIDDGSTDNSWEYISKFATQKKEVVAAKLAKNYGQHNALLCGFKLSQGDYIITIDDDLQNPPEEIPKMIKAIYGKDVDCVIGVPIKKKHAFYRNIGSELINVMYTIVFRKPVSLKMSPFRVIKRSIVLQILEYSHHNPAIGSMLLSISEKIINVEVKHNAAKSRYSLYKLIKLTLDNIVSFTTLPLKIVSLIGFLSFLSSILIVIYLIYEKVVNDSFAPGWTSLIVLNLFFFGLILLSLGVIGEYLIRIIKQVSGHKSYIIQETIL